MSSFKKLLLIGLFFFSLGANAQGKQFSGDWITDIGGAYNEAFVTNDSKSSFGTFSLSFITWK